MTFFGVFQNMAVLVSRGSGNGQWKRCALGIVLCAIASQTISWAMWKANPAIFQVSGNGLDPNSNPNLILIPVPNPNLIPVAVLDRLVSHYCLCVGHDADNGHNKGQAACGGTW